MSCGSLKKKTLNNMHSNIQKFWLHVCYISKGIPVGNGRCNNVDN